MVFPIMSHPANRAMDRTGILSHRAGGPSVASLIEQRFNHRSAGAEQIPIDNSPSHQLIRLGWKRAARSGRIVGNSEVIHFIGRAESPGDLTFWLFHAADWRRSGVVASPPPSSALSTIGHCVSNEIWVVTRWAETRPG